MACSRNIALICSFALLWTAEFGFADDLGYTLAPAPSPFTDETDGEDPTAPPPVDATRPVSAPPSTNATGGACQIFDVTNYGAVGDGNNPANEAFQAAWAAACKLGAQSTMLVPGGVFLLNPIKFSGPCNVTPGVEIRGRLLAPANMDSFPDRAWISFETLSQLNITGVGTGVIDGQGQDTWAAHGTCHRDSNCKLAPVGLDLVAINGGSLGDITSLNSKGFHMGMWGSSNFLIHNANITAPGSSPNTDGIHISGSSNITVTDSQIGTGDDCISIGASTTNITITNVQCGPGHGISLGSLGKYPNEKEVFGLTVRNCTFTGTSNGARIKTWPGSPDNTVSNVIFEDLTMENVSNPIIINQNYCDGKHGCSSEPSRVKLTDIHFKNIKGTSFTPAAVTLTCSEGMPCSEVHLTDIDLQHILAAQSLTAVCSNAQGITAGVQNPTSCLST
ncbi:hypothetical protein NE237_007776 [Protea cynaroides]|uniref:Polygalacturonase n=1 Tax=Protea cynaroides TaxID=273540 RepID=A0A9Q0KPU3_9MAGN|nr:hypothetical protein NE237_007776 [Protea cynaroides]